MTFAKAEKSRLAALNSSGFVIRNSATRQYFFVIDEAQGQPAAVFTTNPNDAYKFTTQRRAANFIRKWQGAGVGITQSCGTLPARLASDEITPCKSTVTRINDAFRKAKRDERLVRGRGYYYVMGELLGYTSTSLPVFSLEATEHDYQYARKTINDMFDEAGIDFQIQS